MRVLIWLALGGILYWALRELLGSVAPDRGARRREGGEEMVRDAQCGVYVPVSTAIKRRVRGKTVYFCSRECEDNYHKKSGG